MAQGERIGDNSYGDLYAAVYDDLFSRRDDVDLVASVLHELAGDGDVIEFGVGTGRLAIPLSRRGHRVYGVDNSSAMLEQLRLKPDSAGVVPVLGDFATVRINEPVSLVFSAFSTIYLPATQEAQVDMFRNAAAHLRPGGRLLVEAFVHDRRRFPNNQEIVAANLGREQATLKIGVLEPASQIIHTQHISFSPGGMTFLPNRLRFIHPSEMDLMGRLAGLRLETRWSDWHRAPFDNSSSNQIAVYTKVADGPL